MAQPASSNSSPEFIIHADGACKGNPGPGGWGAILDRARHPRLVLNGYEAHTTNNRMELCALIAALGHIPEGSRAEVVTDSQYAKNGMTSWIRGWKRKGWLNAQGQPVKNQDLWAALDALCSSRDLRWTWVKGHSGNPGNELADALANEAISARKSTRC